MFWENAFVIMQNLNTNLLNIGQGHAQNFILINASQFYLVEWGTCPYMC